MDFRLRLMVATTQISNLSWGGPLRRATGTGLRQCVDGTFGSESCSKET